MNDEERRQWVLNEETLYSWWQREGGSIRAFIRRHRGELTDYIAARLRGERPARERSFYASGRPGGWRLVQLDQFMPAPAIRMLEEAANAGTLNLTRIKFICRRYADEIRARGNDPDYLAYAIAHMTQAPLDGLGGLGEDAEAAAEELWEVTSGSARMLILLDHALHRFSYEIRSTKTNRLHAAGRGRAPGEMDAAWRRETAQDAFDRRVPFDEVELDLAGNAVLHFRRLRPRAEELNGLSAALRSTLAGLSR